MREHTFAFTVNPLGIEIDTQINTPAVVVSQHNYHYANKVDNIQLYSWRDEGWVPCNDFLIAVWRVKRLTDEL